MKLKLVLFALISLALTPYTLWKQKRQKLVAAWNEASTLESHVLDVANAAPLNEGEWFQVAPYGEHPNRKGKQIFTKTQADRMVASFNSVITKLANAFRGVPIYAGHPDVDKRLWNDDRRLGKIVALEAREDGLWAKAVWNSLGKENLEQGYHVFPSPHWLCERVANGLAPVELISVGLTNNPNIPTSKPVTHNEAELNELASLRSLFSELKLVPTENATLDEMKAALRNACVQKDAGANTEVTDLKAKLATANAQVATLTTERDTARSALANAQAAHRDFAIETAISCGAIAKAEKDAQVAAFNASFDTAFAALKAKMVRTPAYNTTPLALEHGRQEANKAHSRHEQRMAIVEGLIKAHNCDWDRAWALAKADPKHKELFTDAVNA